MSAATLLFSKPLRRVFATGALLVTPLAAAVVTAVTSSSPAAAAVGPAFHPATPSRAVDTRSTAFGALPLLPGESRHGRIVGYGGVPATAVAVALNITVTDPTGDGFITIHSSDVAQPVASNLNFTTGQTVANMVTTAVGADGDVVLFNGSPGAKVHVLIDVAGWYESGFHPVTPTRVLDTRNTANPLRDGEDRQLILAGTAGTAGIPATATGVVLNVTSVAPGSSGFMTVYPASTPRPTASNLNYIPGLVVPNMVVVGLGSGAVRLYGSGSDSDVIVDVSGWFDGGFHAVSPSRIVDNRSGLCGNRLGAGETRLIQVAGQGGVPANAGAVTLTITSLDPTKSTFLTAWPAGTPRPTASNLNTIGGNVPNAVAVGLGADGRIALYNEAGVVNVLVDVTGWYDGDGTVHGTTAGCQTLGLAAGQIANNPAPTAGLAGMAGLVITPARFGNSGPAVSNIQARLYELGFWVADFDGTYGAVTSQAVLAFQKWNGLARTGNLSETDAYLMTMQSYQPSGLGGGTGDRVEVDKGKQLWFLIRNNKTVLTVNTSTGSDIPYTEINQVDGGEITGDAHTPTGRFKVYRTYTDGWENGQLGQLYRPRYFSGGVAVHGAPQIPGYPASHGCVRVSTTFMDWVWATNAMPVGSEVWVHD
jgi:peptidoglycan hydrolase-like protein with peptidoglycan-binding domain